MLKSLCNKPNDVLEGSEKITQMLLNMSSKTNVDENINKLRIETQPINVK